MHSMLRAVTPFAGTCCLVAAAAWAGPLDPPAGPITSTHKTLTDVEPRTAINAVNTPGDADSVYKITQPGSYYLTGPVFGQAGKHGIEIATFDVTIDLMGFDVVGWPGSLDGVTITGTDTSGISVRNGVVRNWGGHGVNFYTVFTLGGEIRDIRSISNAGDGIRAGFGMSVSRCAAVFSGGTGITARGNATVTGCTATANAGNGFALDFVNTLTGCAAISNGGHGVLLGPECVALSCTSSQSGGNGFDVSYGCKLTGCVAGDNTGDGIRASFDCNISACIVRFNDGSGIDVVDGDSVVIDCQSSTNGLDGIRVSAKCLVARNSCAHNGRTGDGAGIHATGSDNRIEDNNCTNADRGVDVDAAGNFIVRNTCSGNTTNWSLVAGNVFGNIMDRTAPASPAVNGNAASSSAGTTDPHANFTY